MELRQLQIFCAAAQTLNFTKAGAQLGYAQSNVTGQIRQLEHELQVQLFERLGRGIQLTVPGRHFFQQASRILALCEEAKQELAPGVYRGTLRIGAAETVCVYRLPHLLRAYRRLHPQVEIRVLTESCDTLFQQLRANEIDAALVLTAAIDAPDLVARTLYDEEMVVVAAAQHRLSRCCALTVADFSGECLLLTPPGCGYRPLVRSVFKAHLASPASTMELSSIGAIKECACCGLGVAVLPKTAVEQELAHGKLVQLAWVGPPFAVRTQLVHHQEKWLAPPLSAFFQLCNETARP